MISKRKQVSLEEARRVGECLYLDWSQVDLEQFRRGLMGSTVPDAGYQGVVRAGRAVLTHMEEVPDYIMRLAKLRAEAGAKHRRNAHRTGA